MNTKTSFYTGIETNIAPRISYQDIYKKYAAVAEIFTLRQWEAVTLYYCEGLTQEEVGKRIGVKRRTICSRLNRAAQRLVEHQKQIRAEQFALLRSEIV